MYNKRMKFSLSDYEHCLARVLYETFGEYNGVKYEDNYLKIHPYMISDFDKDGFIWVNLLWKPTQSEYSYVKHLGNGTLETNNDVNGTILLYDVIEHIQLLQNKKVTVLNKAESIITDYIQLLSHSMLNLEQMMEDEYNNDTGCFTDMGKVLEEIHYDIQLAYDNINNKYYTLCDDKQTKIFTLEGVLPTKENEEEVLKLKDMDEMPVISVRDLIANRIDFNITTDDTDSIFAQRKSTQEIYRVDTKAYELLTVILFELGIGYEYLDEDLLNDICKEYNYE